MLLLLLALVAVASVYDQPLVEQIGDDLLRKDVDVVGMLVVLGPFSNEKFYIAKVFLLESVQVVSLIPYRAFSVRRLIILSGNDLSEFAPQFFHAFFHFSALPHYFLSL